jgi:alpha-glucosidase (family GH31 glycosyl hydrolase)
VDHKGHRDFTKIAKDKNESLTNLFLWDLCVLLVPFVVELENLLFKKIAFRQFKILTFILGFLALLFYFLIALPFWGIPFSLINRPHVPITPPWALECWLWEDDVNTAEYVNELLDGYREHDIPVRTILIDSPWTTHYNNFEIDTTLYPNPKEWFGKLEKDGYRVILWMTSMVDSVSKDTRIKADAEWFNEARSNGHLAGNGFKSKWWKGHGGFIDYTNPKAVDWWQEMQRPILELGIDGWKLDGTSTFFSSRLGKLPIPYQQTFKGLKTTRQYMDLYYRTEYEFGKSINPEFVILGRSIDRLYAHPEGFTPMDAATVSWVGDQKHTWKTASLDGVEGTTPGTDLVMEGIGGFETAIKYILASTNRGYSVVGSDIAGFSGKTIPPRLYIRWTQFSTFCGLFMNGGHGERRLWKRSQEELEIIRKFSWLHTELVPYMYSHVVECSKGGTPLLRPLKGEYSYMFGDDFFVAPIYKDSYKRTIKLPKGQWRYFFNDKELLLGGTTIERNYPLNEMPVYIREGAVVPMNIKRRYTGLGDEESDGSITYLIYPDGKNSFTHYSTVGKAPCDIKVSLENKKITVKLESQSPFILLIHSDTKPNNIIKNDKNVPATNWTYDGQKKKIHIKCADFGKLKFEISLE